VRRPALLSGDFAPGEPNEQKKPSYTRGGGGGVGGGGGGRGGGDAGKVIYAMVAMPSECTRVSMDRVGALPHAFAIPNAA